MVITSPIAEMPGDVGREQRIDDDVAAIHLDAELLGIETLGDGTATGRDEQDVDGELLRFCRGAFAGRHLDLDAFCAGRRRGDLRVLCATLMPRRLKFFSSSDETA